ncbi:hypothetical protein N7492_010506 [Penicillium capsulatum]|uniref:N-acetyltransferase domain-containing protein n=1 Tax=Penicillium capsulatum TaxID=69766 RepID=A0A9W9LDZ5_9EURO|nr:hypothetical protein N7492_010506 [Penicillium capsulatum]KAJ6113008.1 hypothetical protein N7512_008332 [Penicillium capsulatum]
MSLPSGFTLSSVPADLGVGRTLQSIESAAIQDGPDRALSDLLWPGQSRTDDEDEDPFHTVEMLSDPVNTYLWIRDEQIKVPIAYAWSQRAPKRSEVEWAEAYANRHRPPGMNTALMDATSGTRFLKRAKILGSTDSLILKELYVRPEYQRRGLGGALVGHMVQRADQLGLPAYLESSTVGYSLYTRYGFKEIDRVIVNLAAWGGANGEVNKYVLMLRPNGA